MAGTGFRGPLRVRNTAGTKVPVTTAEGVQLNLVAPVTLNTAGNITFTAAQFLSGIILRDCNGGARADNTPTAAQIVAAIKDCVVGSAFMLNIRNTSGTAVAITVTAGTGVTVSGTATIAQSNTKEFLVVVTNATPGSEAVTLYSLGTAVF